MLIQRPTPEHPVYYMAFDLGYKDIGGIIAGDKVPPRKKINDVMTKVLAKQGYLPGSNKHEPTIVLTWFWGTLYVDLMPKFDVSLPDRQINRKQMLRFLGGEKLGIHGASSTPEMPGFEEIAGLHMNTSEMEQFIDAAQNDLYVIAVAGYDMASFRTGKPKRLWMTKIATPSKGFVMDQTLPSMIAIAAPNIGRETVKPVWVDADDKFRAEVLIGTATVVPGQEQNTDSKGKEPKPSK